MVASKDSPAIALLACSGSVSNVSEVMCEEKEDDKSTYDVVTHTWRPDTSGIVEGRTLAGCRRPRAASKMTDVGHLRLSRGRASGRIARGGHETPRPMT